MVGVGQSVMRLNLYCAGKLPWDNNSCPTYLTLSLRKSHLLCQKLTQYLLNMMHAHSRTSMMIWRLMANIRT